MTISIDYLKDASNSTQIADHLLSCNESFQPPLNERVSIDDYARKIADSAVRFEAWSNGILVGLVAAYCNDHKAGTAYITSVSVLDEWRKNGVAQDLLYQCIEHVSAEGMTKICLEVGKENRAAIRLYENVGFGATELGAEFITMSMVFRRGE